MISSLTFSPLTATTCSADVPSTTAAPTTPVTNATSTPPPPPTTTPTPTLPTPTIGNYSIKADTNSTACLLANFGLRIGYTQGEVQTLYVYIRNIVTIRLRIPNTTQTLIFFPLM